MLDRGRQEAWQEAIDLLCFSAANIILGGASFEVFRARLVGMVDFAFDALELPAEARPYSLKQAMATALAYEIWNAAPIPENHFRPRRIAKPERNAPCPCGSGRKYKQCCGTAALPTLGVTETVMLAHVLAHWPKKRLKELPVRELAPDALAMVAERWLDEGREKDATALLEALFERLPELDARAEMAADALLNCYLEAAAPRKKQRFIDALKAAPDKVLRSTGWQRQATVDCDFGNYAAAWQSFREAQRLTPNAPALAHLEILLLASEGRSAEARSRAEFWAARLARDPHEDHSDLIAILRDLAAGTPESLLRNEERLHGPLAGFMALIENWPAPACHYTMKHGTVLSAKKALATAEADWDAVCPFNDQASGGIAWLEFLVTDPLAGQSFLILRDLVDLVLDAPESVPGAAEAVAKQLLERAEALRQTVLAALKAGERELPWGYLDNRPLLSLVASYIKHFADERPDKTLDLLRWSVLTANPTDNIGLREQLIHRLVGHREPLEALAAADRYPDDFAFTEYGRVLALYAAGRLDEAAQAFAKAVARSPKVWKTLAAKAPRRPRMEPGLYVVGGEDEAWIYRENHLALWQSTGALAWAANLPITRKRRGSP